MVSFAHPTRTAPESANQSAAFTADAIVMGLAILILGVVALGAGAGVDGSGQVGDLGVPQSRGQPLIARSVRVLAGRINGP